MLLKTALRFEGSYVVVYDEYTEAGETIVKFFLRDANDKAPYFLLASAQRATAEDARLSSTSRTV